MGPPIAVIDTNIILFLVSRPIPGEKPETSRKRERVLHYMETLRDQDVRFVVPTPVIAELHRDGVGSTIAKQAFRSLRRARSAPLDLKAADVAGEIMRSTLQQRDPMDSRPAMRYDSLIVAIAHTLGARWLVTHNPRDMSKYLKVVGSSVEVVDATDIPQKGQLSLIHQKL